MSISEMQTLKNLEGTTKAQGQAARTEGRVLGHLQAYPRRTPDRSWSLGGRELAGAESKPRVKGQGYPGQPGCTGGAGQQV